MKNTIILASVLIMLVTKTQAQVKSFPINFINLESGFNLSKFNFTDSEYTSSFENGSYLPSQHLAFSVGFDLKDDFNFVLGACFDKHTLVGKPIDISSSRLSYKLNYVSASLGLGYRFGLQDKVSLLLNGGIAYNYLISGVQDIGSATYDLADSDFENTYSYSIGSVLLYQVADATGVYLKYDLCNTMDIKEGEPNNLSYKLTSFVYSLGIRFKINN